MLISKLEIIFHILLPRVLLNNIIEVISKNGCHISNIYRRAVEQLLSRGRVGAGSDMRPDMRLDMRPDMRLDMRSDMCPDMRPNMRPTQLILIRVGRFLPS